MNSSDNSTPRLDVINHFFFYSLGTMGAVLLVFLQGVFLRRILGPEFYGNFHFFTIILIYLTSIHLGVVLAAEREIPYLLGRKLINQLKRTQNVTFSSILFLTGILVVIGIISSFLVAPFINESLKNSFRIILIVLVFQEIIIFYETLTRGYRNFALISKRIFLTALFNIVFAVSLGYFFGLLGALFGLLIAAIIMALFYQLTYLGEIKIEFHKEAFLYLLKIGLPILLSGLFYTLLTSVDSIIIYVKLGAEMTGLYSLTPLFFMVANLTPRIMGIILYPRFLFQYGEEKENDISLYERINKALKLTIIITSVSIGVLFFILDPIVNLFLPKYLTGLLPAKIILIFSLFLSIVPIQGFFLIAKKQLKASSLINAFSLLFAILAIAFVIIFYPSLKNVALATGIAYLINGSAIFFYINSQFIQQRSKIILNLFRLYFPFFYALISMAASFLITQNIKNEILSNLTAVPLFLIISSPLFIKLQKEFNLFSDLYKYLKSYTAR